MLVYVRPPAGAVEPLGLSWLTAVVRLQFSQNVPNLLGYGRARDCWPNALRTGRRHTGGPRVRECCKLYGAKGGDGGIAGAGTPCRMPWRYLVLPAVLLDPRCITRANRWGASEVS